ncbi:MAG: histidine kinase dimerization/phosphoacceptor domain -containing protein [Myxococcota bacterium]
MREALPPQTVAILDAMPQCAFLIDANGELLYQNVAATRLRCELPPNLPFDGVLSYPVKMDGETGWLQGRCSPLTLDGLNAYLVQIQVITHNVLNQLRLEKFFDATREGVLFYAQGIITDINDAGVRMLGYDSPNEIIGRPLMTLVAPEDQNFGLENIRTKPETPYRIRSIRRDGTVFNAAVLGRSIQRGDQIVRVLTFQDLTALDEAHQEIERRDAQLRAMLRVLPVGIGRLDQRNDLIFANDALLELIDDPPLPVSAARWQTLVHPVSPEEIQTVLQHAYAGAVIQRELRWTDRQGKLKWVMMLAAPEIGPGEQIHGVVVVTLDITARRAAEEQLESELETQAILLREIHHRVKNNLNLIAGLLQLQSHAADDPIVREALAQSERRVSAIALVHRGIYQNAELAAVDLSRYLSGLIHNLMLSTGIDDRVQVKLAVDGVLPLEKAVPFALILSELITNAFKHAFPVGRHGVLSVQLSLPDGDGARQLIVEDDGIGLPDEEKGGTLGMELVRLLAMQLHGSVNAENRPGGGARFTLRFIAP